jgi:hypothetical protein
MVGSAEVDFIASLTLEDSGVDETEAVLSW